MMKVLLYAFMGWMLVMVIWHDFIEPPLNRIVERIERWLDGD